MGAFVDENRDGIKQDQEMAVPNAMVRLKGTRMALRTDRGGFFTIQNIKVGIYDVQIDGRSLPLGYSMAMRMETANMRKMKSGLKVHPYAFQARR